MMSQYVDSGIMLGDESWFSGSQLFSYINADDMGPIDVQQPVTVYQQPTNQLEHQPHQQQHQHQQQQYHLSHQHNHQQHQSLQQQQQQSIMSCKSELGCHNSLARPKSAELDAILPFEIEYSPQEFPFKDQSISIGQELVPNCSGDPCLGPPPVLVPRFERKMLTVDEHLEYRRALAKERQEQLKAKLEREPLQMPPKVIKKPSGKKMTGRERLQELEKQEVEEIRKRDHLVDMISSLEAKNKKLRDILVEIVTKSPNINREILEWLGDDNLFTDSHVNGWGNRL